MTIASIAKSPQFIALNPGDAKTVTICIPNMQALKANSVEEIRALKLSKLNWFSDTNYILTLQVKMSDDSEGKGGTSNALIN